ncbi:hypothetical protein [Acidithrix ferrooxidans]|uniref:Uncharacterized protein n=1 Tax=Acidithrix ferrooxidans TaxID=1280514 RepID=A0A0D8HIJ4_9ACTN|nr:hypothetical protein [Acidithrix ferrooxidans]KJF16866.1 hypothetical protein AXFE_22870 [Acidithrix ferrooxidans]
MFTHGSVSYAANPSPDLAISHTRLVFITLFFLRIGGQLSLGALRDDEGRRPSLQG